MPVPAICKAGSVSYTHLDVFKRQGLRREQSASRKHIAILEIKEGRFKFHPIADWSDIDIGAYILQHDLPEHPLLQQGYVSVGDTHTTRPLQPGMDASSTRFFGLRRECGLHFDL